MFQARSSKETISVPQIFSSDSPPLASEAVFGPGQAVLTELSIRVEVEQLRDTQRENHKIFSQLNMIQ